LWLSSDVRPGKLARGPVRMYQGRLAETDDSMPAVRRYVGELLGINQATLRNSIDDRRFTNRPAVPAVVKTPPPT
jgi:transposase